MRIYEIICIVLLLVILILVGSRENSSDCKLLGGPRAIYRDDKCWAPDENGKWRVVNMPWDGQRQSK